jgi:hypothetical protein
MWHRMEEAGKSGAGWLAGCWSLWNDSIKYRFINALVSPCRRSMFEFGHQCSNEPILYAVIPQQASCR